MSIQIYQSFTLQPDFTEAPSWGTIEGRDTIESSTAGSFSSWGGDTEITSQFTYQTTSAEEWRLIRTLADSVGGRAAAFYIPTWQPNFILAEDFEEGTTQIKVVGNWHSENMTEARPDTLGRRIFIVNHIRQFSEFEIFAATDDGEGNDILTITQPSPIAANTSKSVVGFSILSRLASDTIDSQHVSPNHARMKLAFRSVRHTRRLNQQETAQSSAIATLKGNHDVIATDEDPEYSNTRITEAFGPEQYATVQAEHFSATWQAKIEDGQVVLTNPNGDDQATVAFSGNSSTRHISLVFSGTGREIIAWDNNDQTSTIAYLNGSGERVEVDFTGISPVLFNTFAIDSLVNAGTATVACFYLKREDSTIYARIAAENWTTEHRFLKSPLAPISLHRAIRVANRIEIVGMDAGHRKARWRSEEYQPPFPSAKAGSGIREFKGSYINTTIIGTVQPTAARSEILEKLTGEYFEYRPEVYTEAPETSGTSVIGKIKGNYINARITGPVQPTEARSEILEKLTGAYLKITIKTEEPIATATSEIKSLTGSYEPV